MHQQLPTGFNDQPWIGRDFETTGILVLGESWYGDWGAEYNSDASYIQAYLDGKLSDRMYTKIANACQSSKESFWQSVMFTNLVIWAGASSKDRPTTHMYLDGYFRLRRLLEKYKPRGVWLLGKEQAQFSSHLLISEEIPFSTSVHPTAVGVTTEHLSQSWQELLTKLARTQGSDSKASAKRSEI